MAGKLIEKALTPIAGAMGGNALHNIERPGCLHMATVAVNTTVTNSVTQKERERVLAELNANPCPQCAEENKING